jgi:NADPH:quinone reductase-like Zn-dependent oxidoreductase
VRAVICDRYGPPEVLRVDDVPRPVPEVDEVLVRVRASTVNRTDTGLRSAEYGFARVITGLRRPRHQVVGTELAGVVEAVGSEVTEFDVGDHVFGVGSGTHADFATVRARGALAPMPAGMSFVDAAAISDGACTAMAFLRQAKVGAGSAVLVYGASGSIGTATVQLTSHLGAQVTAVCGPAALDTVRSLGAHDVIDHEQRDVLGSGATYDVIVDAVGKLSARRSRHSLRDGGVYITAGSPEFFGRVLVLALLTTVARRRRVRLGLAQYRKEDVLALKELVEAGAYRAVVDRVYPLAEVVEAHRYVDTQQKIGNVGLTLDGPHT